MPVRQFRHLYYPQGFLLTYMMIHSESSHKKKVLDRVQTSNKRRARKMVLRREVVSIRVLVALGSPVTRYATNRKYHEESKVVLRSR